MTVEELAAKWKLESDQSILDAMRNGAPHNVVTEERMRYLVFLWVTEIDDVKASAADA
jgi:hypothetical protein